MSKPVIHFLPSHEVHLTTSCGKVDPPEWSRIEGDVTCKRCLAMMTKLSPSPILAAPLNEIKFDKVGSYATRENARAAVSKKFGLLKPNLRYRFFIYTREDGRFVPVFIGQEAIAAGVHFEFTVVG